MHHCGLFVLVTSEICYFSNKASASFGHGLLYVLKNTIFTASKHIIVGCSQRIVGCWMEFLKKRLSLIETRDQPPHPLPCECWDTILNWREDLFHLLQLGCPKCKSKLGSFVWYGKSACILLPSTWKIVTEVMSGSDQRDCSLFGMVNLHVSWCHPHGR